MKIIHTSDWHLGQRLRNFDRRDEHAHFIKQLCRIVADRQPDVLLVSGDVFDTAIPIYDVQNDFVTHVIQLRQACPLMKIVITAGNHDSGQRLNIDRPLWEALNVSVIGSCQRDENGMCDLNEFIVDVDDKGTIAAVPYFHKRNFPLASAECESDKRQTEFFSAITRHARAHAREKPVVLMAHLAVEGCNFSCHKDTAIGGLDMQAPDQLGNGYDYLALGHIHHPQTLKDGNGAIRYSGSPIPITFAEDFEHTVSVVDIKSAGVTPEIEEIGIHPLRALKTIQPESGTLDDAIEMLAALEDGDESYLRVLIGSKSQQDPNAIHRATEALAGKKARLCSIERMREDETDADSDNSHKVLNVTEFKAMKPMEVAQMAYKKIYNAEMPEDWIAMLKEAIQDAEQNK